MSQSHDRSAADRNLLFGVLALQVNFISRDALVAGMQAWALDKKKTLGQVLIEQAKLSAGQVQALDALLVQHLHTHSGDVESTLSSLPEGSQVRSTLATFNDDDVQASVAKLGSWTENGSTRAYCAVGSREGGRYRPLRPHARGGLGEVFVAEDTELHREVALKEIKAEHADDPDSRGRFVLEAEITGGLEHPGIVPVYGLGAYTNGRPFYAMRFIRGDSLKEAAARFHEADKPGRAATERSLAFRQLLRRFVDVCNAVAYAHSRGVLHRDLKPSNIMLGRFGETLVVDWGLAKAGIKDHNPDVAASNPVDDERTLRPSSGSSVEKTQAGSTLGTPHFMSPEQASGRLTELAPASDIFSLGATLYVLLTGKRPFESKDDLDVLALVRACRFTPPIEAKPGTPPALNAICLRAMAHKPADRYHAALDLAADLEHWLADEPVAAYPEPVAQRLSRWGRRHRPALVGAAVFLVSAVVALSLSTGLIYSEQQKTAAEQKKTAEQKQIAEDRLVLVVAEQKKTAEQKQIAEDNLELVLAEQKKTAEQRQIADKNYVLARDVGFNSIDLIESTQVELASNPAWQAKRKDILVTAARSSKRFLELEPNDLELQTKAAKVYRYTANFHRLENDIAAAEPLYRESIRLQKNLLDKCAYDPARLDHLAATLRDEATILAIQGKLGKAAQNYASAITIVTKLQTDHPDTPAFDRSLATAQLDLSAIEYGRGKSKEAKELAQSAADLYAALQEVPAGQSHAYDPLLRAAALNRIAVIEREAGLIKEARTTHSLAAKIMKSMADAKPANVVYADILHHQARCRLEQALTLAQVPDKRADAEKNLAATALQWQMLSKSYDKVPQYRASHAYALLELGRLRAQDKRHDEAVKDLEAACALLEPLVEKFAGAAAYHAQLGQAYAEQARLARIKGDAKAAAGFFEKADKTLSRAVELSPDNVHDVKMRDEVRADRAR